jgi:hypothetical protein
VRVCVSLDQKRGTVHTNILVDTLPILGGGSIHIHIQVIKSIPDANTLTHSLTTHTHTHTHNTQNSTPLSFPGSSRLSNFLYSHLPPVVPASPTYFIDQRVCHVSPNDSMPSGPLVRANSTTKESSTCVARNETIATAIGSSVASRILLRRCLASSF